MALDLIPRNLLSFPSFDLPSFWDDSDMILNSSTQGGLTIYEDDKKIYVEAAVPGLESKDIEVTVQDDYLWIKGETKEEESDKKKKYYRKATSSFSYRIAIPGNVDSSVEPEASCKNGVMTVSFVKSAKAQPKKIAVK